MVESTGLENQRTCKRTVGSNPTLSAIFWPKKGPKMKKSNMVTLLLVYLELKFIILFSYVRC